MTMTGKWGGQKKLDTFVMLHIHQDINYDSYQTSVKLPHIASGLND